MGPALAARPVDAAQYRRDHAALSDAMRAGGPRLAWYAERTAPYPLTIPERDVAVLERLYQAITAGISATIEHYLHDPRLQETLALPPPFVELLRRAARHPYRPGALRPDFLLDVDGVAKVCEVNARFPTNGFLCSYYTNQVVEGLDHLAGRPARAVPGLRCTLDALASRFEPGPLVVVLDREGGTEIFLMIEELARRGIEARTRTPAELRVERGRILDATGPVEQFILELERDELLDLPLDLFDALAASPRTFNDVRTLILGHDKRMLAVLGDRSVVTDLVAPSDADLLVAHVIPTFNAADRRIADDVRTDPARWVLKRNSSGRGVDLLVGAACDPAQWRHAVAHEAHDRAAQHFVEQLVLTMPTLSADGELVDQAVHVVGLLPGFDGRPFGPGLFRASAESVINVAGDRGVLVPTMIAL
ncbi:MAG: hypothetical protein ACRDZ2_15310 [Ilumatobacteraceae bacterium]